MQFQIVSSVKRLRNRGIEEWAIPRVLRQKSLDPTIPELFALAALRSVPALSGRGPGFLHPLTSDISLGEFENATASAFPIVRLRRTGGSFKNPASGSDSKQSVGHGVRSLGILPPEARSWPLWLCHIKCGGVNEITFYLTEIPLHDLYIGFKNCYVIILNWQGDKPMLKSPCLGCELVGQDKNKCLQNCDKLKEYQEFILKQGIYAKV